jgi:hypothetical protein
VPLRFFRSWDLVRTHRLSQSGVVLAVYSSLIVLMASIGEGGGGSGTKSASVQNEVDPHVADLLRRGEVCSVQ